MTPAAFRAKWSKVTLNELQAHRHLFLELARFAGRKRRVAALVTTAINVSQVHA